MTRRGWIIWLVAAGLAVGGLPGWAGEREKEGIRMASSPDVSPDGRTLVFEWNGDIWRAPVEGGVAVPLTRNPALDGQPHFSPDGSEIAFVSRRTGDAQAYVMPASGGIPRQVTHHSEGASLLDWFPDGQSLLIHGVRDYGPLLNLLPEYAGRMFRVAAGGRSAERLVFDDYGKEGRISPDGTRVLFVREFPPWNRCRRGYRGSAAAQLWMYDLRTKAFTLIHREPWNCFAPMWMPDGTGFYYLSEKSGLANLWRHDLATGAEKQLTFFQDDPVSSPAISRDGTTIVFSKLFDLYRFRPADGRPAEKIGLWSETDGSRNLTRRRWCETAWNCGEWGSVDFTADGLETAFTALGNLWVMDTVLREPRQVTGDSGCHDSDAFFTADSGSLLFLRDTGDRANLWRATRGDPALYWWQNSRFVLEELTHDSTTKSLLSPSPDGKCIAYVQGGMDLFIADLDGRNQRLLYHAPDISEYVWSPDGKWIAGSFCDGMDNNDIWLLAVDGSTPPFNVSRSPHYDVSPAWSPDGKILAYVGGNGSGRDSDIRYVYLARGDSEITPRDAAIEKALKTMEDGRRREAAPAGVNDARSAKTERAAGKTPAAEPALPAVRVDLEGLADRVCALAMPALHESGLFWADAKHLAFYAAVNGRKGTYTVELPDKFTPVLLAEGAFARAHVGRGGKLFSLLDGVPAIGAQKYPFRAYQELDLAAYRRLGFRKAWQILRDGFYDARLNNLDWDAVRVKYEEMAAAAPDMRAFSRIIEMLNGELGASHLGFTPNSKDWEPAAETPAWRSETAHLGLRFDPAHAGPGLKVRDVIAKGPADCLRSRVLPGETVLKIDGKEVGPDTDLTLLLNGRLQREITLRVADAAGRQRDVVVHPVSYHDARDLLREQEQDDSLRLVESLSRNRLAYLNIEKMDWPSFDRFEREVFARGVGKAGLVIDVRNNPGGVIADRLLTILCRPQHSITVTRGGEPCYPVGYQVFSSWDKPIVVLCSQRYSPHHLKMFPFEITNQLCQTVTQCSITRDITSI
jgi:Tol biopolymer transport system component